MSEPHLVLLAVRLRSRGSAEAIRQTFVDLGGDESCDIEAELAVAEAAGRIRSRGDERRLSLTPRGEEELRTLLATETDGVGRAELTAAYEAFLPLNHEFLSVVTAPEGGENRLVALEDLAARLTPLLDSLSARLARFDRYETRFVRALHRAANDPTWIDGAGVDSVHTIWFELHEHLLAILGRDRTGER